MVKTSYNKKMRKQTLYITSILILAVFLLSACGPKTDATPTPDTDSIVATSIVQTMQVMAETQAAQVTPTLAATATPAVLPSVTPATVSLPTSTVQTVSLPANCLVAGLVSETIPDGTVIGRGSSFTKTWSIRNGGTCTWGTNYKMVFESGEKLGATVDSVALTQSVAPGMMTSVSVKMTAPNVDGTYIGYWDLLSDAGVLVGRFSVNIYVGTATPTPFSITSISYPSTPIELTVGNTTTVRITVVSDGPGTATYSITSAYGVTSPQGGDITFTAASSKPIDYSIQCSSAGSYDLDIEVYIDNPNHQKFPLHYAQLHCN